MRLFRRENGCKHEWVEVKDEGKSFRREVIEETPHGILYQEYRLVRCARCGMESKRKWFGGFHGDQFELKPYWELKMLKV